MAVTVIADPTTDEALADDVVSMLQSITFEPMADEEDEG